MRILVLVHEYPPVGGGGGKVAQDICEGLSVREHDVRVLTTHIKGLPLREMRGGVRVRRLRCGRKHAYKATFADMALFIFAGFWFGIKAIMTWKPDVMHVHFAVPAGVIGWLLSFLTHTPYVLTAHLGDVPGGVPEKTDKWFKWVAPFTPGIWKRARQVVAVSSFTRELALKHYPVQIKVINNGVDNIKFDPGDIAVGKPPRILFVGRIVTQKNPLQIVRSLVDVQDLRWECTIVGDGALRGEMEEEAERLGVRGRMHFTGWIAPEEVKEWFQKSDILFMPSLSEGLPVVGVQALSMGLAFVAGRVGGFIDLVKEDENLRNGYLHLPFESESFTKSLRSLLMDKEKLGRCRKNSRILAQEFDLGQIVEQYDAILKECTK